MSDTQNDSRREYVKQLKELNLDDPEFEIKFNQINKSFNSSHTDSKHRDNIDMQTKTQSQSQSQSHSQSEHRKHSHHHNINDPFNMLDVFNMNPFHLNPFNSLSRIHNNLYRMMNSKMLNSDFDSDEDDDIFFKKGEFDEKKLDDLDVNTYNETATKSNTNIKQNINEPQKYYKYVSSMTTYDNNGVRKAKSISRTEKYDGKHKSVKQVSKFQDGDKYVEEYLNPDGTTKRIEKKIENNMIE